MKRMLLILIVLSISLTCIADGIYKITVDGYLASTSKAMMVKVSELIAVKDWDAVNSLISTNAVFWLAEGKQVQIVDTTWDGWIKIRLRGSIIEVWTFREAVR